MADGTELTPNTTPDQLRKRVGVGAGELLRTSSRREAYLQKIAGLVALRNIRLYVQGQGAHVKLNKNTPEINVTGEGFDQPVTDISQDEYDLLCQEVLTMHEDGHVLFSDWSSFERYMNRVNMQDRHLFKHIWNAAEDGAIERAITSEFNVKDDFRVFYANVVTSQPGSFGIEQESLLGNSDEKYYKFPFAHAVITAILDSWTDELYDVTSGALTRLLDPSDEDFVFGHEDDQQLFLDFLPEIEDYVADMLTTPRARDRNKRTYDFWQRFAEEMDDAKVSGKQPLSDSGGGLNGMPDDAQPGMGDATGDADSLGEGSVVVEVDVPSGGGGLKGADDDEPDGWGMGEEGDDEEEGDDDEEGAGGEGDDEEQQDDADAEGDGSDGDDGDEQEGDSDDSDSSDDEGGDSHGSGGIEEAAENVERRYSKEIDREADDVAGDGMLDEAEEFLQILKDGQESGDMPDPDLRLVIPESDDYDTDRFLQAKNDARALERLWRQKLRMESQTRTRRGTRFGTPDSRSMHKSKRSTRIFKQRNTPEKKDYECIIVLDRSSSMNGQLVRQAERAAGALLMSLDNVGVNTSMLSLDDNKAVLEVPFGSRVEDYKNVIFTESNAGSTPLAEATYLARHRVNKHSGRTRFMIVVTDGRPDNSNDFMREVEACNFPVLGVQIGGHGYEDVIRACDRSTVVPQNGNILATLRNLVNEVMF